MPVPGGAQGTAGSAQTLIGEWLDHVPKRPPGSVIGQVGKHLAGMLACILGVPVEGRDDPTIDAALAALAIQPAERQVRVLEVTADHLGTRSRNTSGGLSPA